jgi:hypothetical protein
MKKLFILLVLLVVGVGAVGFHRGWFQLNCCAGGDDGKPTVTLTVDKDKINEDKAKALDKARDKAQTAADKVAHAADRHGK